MLLFEVKMRFADTNISVSLRRPSFPLSSLKSQTYGRSVAEPERVGAGTLWLEPETEPAKRCEERTCFYYFLAYFILKRS